MKLSELAALIGAEFTGAADVEITGVAGLAESRSGDITFAADEKRLKDLGAVQASAVILPQNAPDVSLPSLRAKNPRLAFARALTVLYPRPAAPAGVSDRAVVAPDARVHSSAAVHPNVVVAKGATIGARAVLYPGVYIGARSSIGDDTVVYPNVTVREDVTIGARVIIHAGSVIGSDGFGFVTDGGRHHKIPQVGGVVIGDDVEIGANCAIDRATLGATVIKSGTKLDNLVHIAHNVSIGEHSLIAGQVGIAGSTKIGSYVVFAGQVGVGDHVTIGDRVMAGGKAVIPRDVEPGQVIAGFNAMPIRDWLKVQAVLPKLPELKKIIAQLEQRVEKLENTQSTEGAP